MPSRPETTRLSLTPAELRVVNAALALYEAEDDHQHGPVGKRCRAKVWAAMDRAGLPA